MLSLSSYRLIRRSGWFSILPKLEEVVAGSPGVIATTGVPGVVIEKEWVSSEKSKNLEIAIRIDDTHRLQRRGGIMRSFKNKLSEPNRRLSSKLKVNFCKVRASIEHLRELSNQVDMIWGTHGGGARAEPPSLSQKYILKLSLISQAGPQPCFALFYCR